MQLGLLVLIATPVARVLFAAFAFALERDWMYVVVSLIVFAVLMATLTGWRYRACRVSRFAFHVGYPTQAQRRLEWATPRFAPTSAKEGRDGAPSFVFVTSSNEKGQAQRLPRQHCSSAPLCSEEEGYFCSVESLTIPPAGPAFSAFAFFTARVLSTHSSAVFRSWVRAAGSPHSMSAFSRHIKLR